MNENYLDFEQQILYFDEKIKLLTTENNLSNIEKIKKLQKTQTKLIKKIFSNLSDWQITKLARHPLRPYTLDYISSMFTDFDELAGDRTFSNDKSIIGGLARIDERPVIIIGNQKGRSIKDKLYRNFGMSSPDGYRKARRLMKMGEKFNIPIITFIDTPGAYPGRSAEERGQSEAIARNLRTMSNLRVPVICNVIGEGGSLGALAIGVGDKINMLEYSIYSVISPEGCASILWKNSVKAEIAAEALGITAIKLKKLKLIDHIITEPLGGAHRDILTISKFFKNRLLLDLMELDSLTKEELLYKRYNRLMNYGYC